MNGIELSVRLLAGLLLILINGFFVAIEFALTRVRQYPEAEFDKPGLRRAWEMTNDLEIYLTSCQVGITASSIAVGIIAEPALAALFEPYFESTVLASVGAGGIIAFLIINLLHLTHGEQTPTYLGVERTKFVTRYGATPLYVFAKLISPLITIGDTVAKWTLKLFGVEMTGAWLEAETDAIESRADLRNRIGSVLDRGDLSDERREEVLNALSVDEQSVGDVMVSTDDIVSLSTAEPVQENIDRIGGSPHTRFPLVGEGHEAFHGIVYAPTVIENIDELRAGDVTFRDIATPPMTLAAETSISDAIDQFQAASQELALVLNDGEVVGLVTATDTFEAVMGDLEDPLDVKEDAPVSNNT
ncbi:inosine monophosphate dehydrogenase [Haloferax mucosum ATCC BAA-1512]|uniref:Inosine monophosphate dehydrogenase n=1 Tax=Haloferax mucosum ATCC BAA-1512 TaxID=662479 RepID=M0ILV2_9EURY|nr:hemolysin family protein [Haloferax mucosum]ELZ96992.1 inosine monophosphate dehydrogenase [Haloferax mucosum ATCC BAA-1512]